MVQGTVPCFERYAENTESSPVLYFEYDNFGALIFFGYIIHFVNSYILHRSAKLYCLPCKQLYFSALLKRFKRNGKPFLLMLYKINYIFLENLFIIIYNI